MSTRIIKLLVVLVSIVIFATVFLVTYMDGRPWLRLNLGSGP